MNKTQEVLNFKDRQAWRSWLDAHHQKASESWLVIQKKGSPNSGLSLNDAVEEALCYGWIDGKLNTRDNHTYLLRFSPRRPNSVWSVRNIKRIENLQKNGLMMEAGLEAVRVAMEIGVWEEALDRERVDVIPPDLELALRRKKGAFAAYRQLPKSRKQRYLYWLQSAKREDTRQRRIEEIVKQTTGDR